MDGPDLTASASVEGEDSVRGVVSDHKLRQIQAPNQFPKVLIDRLDWSKLDART